MNTTNTKHVALALTGASGAQYGVRLLEQLLAAGLHVSLMLSKPAQVVIGTETDLRLPARDGDIQKFFAEMFNAGNGQLRVYGKEQWTAPIASGSSAPDAMVICPCTTATLSAVAGGASRSLIERGADVMLKERRKLIIVPRETPFSEIHLDNMLKLARMGVVVLPANPGFYHQPKNVQDIVDFIVARVLDHLDVDHELVPRWANAD